MTDRSDQHRLDELAAPTTPDPDLVDVLTGLFADYRATRATPTAVVDLDRGLWQRLEDLGLTRLTGSESAGGSGGGWVDAAALLGLAAAAAAPVPLAEHDVLGGWLLEAAGLPNDGGPADRMPSRPVGGRPQRHVGPGREPHRGALGGPGPVAGGRRAGRARRPSSERRNLAGEPSDTVEFDLDDLEAGTVVAHEIGEQFHLRGALARCAQVVGAMERVVEVVLTHVREREQFGRPIGRFQAVQHLVADIASETALARAATDAAVARAAASDWRDPGMLFAVGVAKSCVGHAASVVVRGAHQVLGAIGTTLEHELHTLTKPILARRSEYGSLQDWDETLTALASSAGRDRLWTLITTGRAKPSSARLHPYDGG